MKIIISPAKSLDFQKELPTNEFSMPLFLNDSISINKSLKLKSPLQLKSLMSISDKLADLNWQRNNDFKTPFNIKNARPAIFTFNGDVYSGLDAFSLNRNKINKAQESLRILSGLYGFLKPLDLIQPYRLEMGTKLKVGSTENLYKFWDHTVAKALNDELEDGELLINLASSEYFKVIPAKVLKVPMITPVFKDFKNGQYKIVMTYAKMARGLMVRYIIDNNVKTIEELKGFNTDKYRFSEEMSSGNDLVFTR